MVPFFYTEFFFVLAVYCSRLNRMLLRLFDLKKQEKRAERLGPRTFGGFESFLQGKNFRLGLPFDAFLAFKVSKTQENFEIETDLFIGYLNSRKMS